MDEYDKGWYAALEAAIRVVQGMADTSEIFSAQDAADALRKCLPEKT